MKKTDIISTSKYILQNETQMGYKNNVIKGFTWMSAFRFVTRIVSFIKTAVLARLLQPSDFGLFGIATLVLSFLETLTETGINVIIVQSKNDVHKYINSTWVVSIIRGICICLFIVLIAPFVSRFFNTPHATSILLYISIIPLIRGFINPAESFFQKELQFKYEFLFRSVIFIFDALVSLFFALVLKSVYSLVWGLLAGVLLELVLSFTIIRPLPKFKIEKKYFSNIFHRGKWITAYGIFNYLAQQGDNIFVGKLLGASALGVYEMAYKISILPISEVSDVVNRVVFPIYVKIEHEKKRLLIAFLKMTIFISTASISLGLIIFIYPEIVVSIILGNKWFSVIPLLRILVIYGVIRAITGSASALFLATQRQQYVTGMTLIRFVGLFIALYPLIYKFGIIGAAYAALLSVLVEVPLIIYYVFLVFKNTSKLSVYSKK